MADHYDPVPDLALLLIAARDCRSDTVIYGQRVTLRLGIDEDDSAEAAAGVLREALGLPPGGTCELVSLRHGTPCTQPAVVRLTGTCACCGTTRRRACEEHRMPEAPWWCNACYRLPEPDGHKCPVTLLPAGQVAP
jgi:hypothetical protein